jgi:DsbC/DsbD-like thiol-disulfide interchange protein
MVGSMNRVNLIALALWGCLAQTALAESQDDVLSARLLPGWKAADGHYMTAVSLTLAPGWKTYWRAPGEAGIPPEFDWSGSQNLGSVQIHWPSPRVISLNGMDSIGYLDGLTLPVEVTPLDPSKPVHLALQMDLGVCHDICMPAAVRLSADLTGPGAPDAAIAAALKAGPIDGSAAGLAALTCRLTPIDDGLRVTADLDLPPQGGSETVVFETEDPEVWISTSTADRRGKVLMASADLVPSSGKPFALDRSGVTVTILAEGHSVEIRGCPAP